MASLVYNKCVQNAISGNINFAADTFKVMLVTSAYTPNKDTHQFRSDVTNEVTGTGYTAGGTASTCTVSLNTTSDYVEATFGNVSWGSATITARACVIYKSRGGASSADELVAYVDFGSDVASTNATFAVTFSSALRFQN